MSTYPIHPAAELFPEMSSEELEALTDDIRAHGLRHPITLYQGQILDGRHRYLACQQAGIDARYETLPDDRNPFEYVWSENAERRHLDPGTKTMIRLRQLKASEAWQEGQDQRQAEANRKRSEAMEGNQNASKTQTQNSPVSEDTTLFQPPPPQRERDDIANSTGVSPATVARAMALDEKRPDLADHVQAGTMTLAAATQTMKRDAKVAELETLAAREVEQPTGLFDVLVIDPPWPMHKIEREVRPNQVETDYPTMSEDALKALRLPYAEHCHVWLWTTHKYLPMAFRLIEHWGLTYVCTFVWHKAGGFQVMGLPQYNCEFALYAWKGNPVFLDTKAFPVCFEARRGRHSEKPDAFYAMVRRVTGGRRLDMFARRKIDGFQGWGQEAAEPGVANG